MRPLPVALALAVLAAPPAATAPEVVDGIAAQVGSAIVLVSDVRRFAAPVEQEMRKAGAPESEIAKMRADILERMIERRLLDQAIRRAELEASEADLDAAIEAIAVENGLTLDQLKYSVAAQGMGFEAYREQIRDEIQRQKLISAVVSSKVRVEESEVRALYAKHYADQPSGGDEVHVRQILVPFAGDSARAESEACGRAKGALARVRAGEPFATVAREMSAVNPRQGGDVGWIHVSNVAAWMAKAVAPLEPGQTSDVLRTRFGCNLLHLVERRTFTPVTYEDAKAELSTELFDRRMAAEYAEFVEKLRSQTYIERKGFFAEATRIEGMGGSEGPSTWAPRPR